MKGLRKSPPVKKKDMGSVVTRTSIRSTTGIRSYGDILMRGENEFKEKLRT